MRLNLPLTSEPKTTLRTWATEIRKRLFSSPDEFVYQNFDASPFNSTNFTFSAAYQACRFMQHGKFVHVVMVLQFDVIGPGATPCLFEARLPGKFFITNDQIDTVIQIPVSINQAGASTYGSTPGTGTLVRQAGSDRDAILFSIDAAAPFAAGVTEVFVSACYQAA